ncbi:unnamed protein product [Durusdinium trenchii]|uniref:Uncharacterized protein n=1 Tax=Durusdinium trenchii TaxID=1381693 RepID=A0ABP0QJP4_9DINO
MEAYAFGWMSIVLAAQILVQAGCRPWISILAISVVSCTQVLPLFRAVLQQNTRKTLDLKSCWKDCFFLIGILLSHSIDFSARLRAIKLGMDQSRENALCSRYLNQTARRTNAELGIELGCLRSAEGAEPIRRKIVAVALHADTGTGSFIVEDDIPITDQGLKDVRLLSEELKQQGIFFDVVISSPALHCLQTAWIFGEQFHAKVLLDEKLSQVMNPSATSPLAHALYPLDSRISIGRVMDKQTDVRPESKEERFAQRFLTYLTHSCQSGKSCLLVTHARMLQVCASILPPIQHRKITSLGHLAIVLATRRIEGNPLDLGTVVDDQVLHGLTSPRNRSQSVDLVRESRIHEELRDEVLNEVLRDAELTSWSVWLHSVKSSPFARGPSCFPKPTLQSWRGLRGVILKLPRLPEPLEQRCGSILTLPESSVTTFTEILSKASNGFEKYEPTASGSVRRSVVQKGG